MDWGRTTKEAAVPPQRSPGWYLVFTILLLVPGFHDFTYLGIIVLLGRWAQIGRGPMPGPRRPLGPAHLRDIGHIIHLCSGFCYAWPWTRTHRPAPRQR